MSDQGTCGLPVVLAAGGVKSVVGAPTEKVSEPLIGCPSSETTRQTTTVVPSPSDPGRAT